MAVCVLFFVNVNNHTLSSRESVKLLRRRALYGAATFLIPWLRVTHSFVLTITFTFALLKQSR